MFCVLFDLCYIFPILLDVISLYARGSFINAFQIAIIISFPLNAKL